MSGQYPYGAPPPPPSAAPASSYPYGQQSYSSAPRGGSTGAGSGGRGRSYAQGPSRVEYGSVYGSYPQQDYSSHNAASYGQQPSNGYWSGSPAAHSSSPLPQSNYHPNYASPNSYPPQSPATYPPAAYHAGGQRATYTPTYNSPTPEYPAQQWSDSNSYGYANRGGRGGYPGDRGGHRSDPAPSALRVGYEQGGAHAPQASNGYSQQYPPSHHSTAGYAAPYPSYPPPVPAYPGPAPPASGYSHNPSHRGRGRDGFSGHRGRGGHHNDRNDKFRHKGQRPQHHENHNAQKSDAASAKKKKRKTNTLGLTPGDADESDKEIDEEKRIVETLGDDLPDIGDLAVWLAERRAKFPTKARVQAKQEAEAAKRAEAGKVQKPAPKNEDEERAELLRRELAEVERKLEKRKRETNDEGDEMRAPKEETESSDDEPPETQTTKKTASYLPPPPITRADPTAHCKYYSTGGICGKKGKCRFVHDPEMRERALQEQAANGGRITLKQRLLRNEKEIEDLAIIQSIVSLRGNGKMPPASKPAAKAPGSSTRTTRSTSPTLKEAHHTETENSPGQTILPTPDSDSAPVEAFEPKVKLSKLQNLYASAPCGYSGETVQQRLDQITKPATSVANASLAADLHRRYTNTLTRFITFGK